MQGFENLVTEIRQCRLCEPLPLGAKPIVQLSPQSKILIAGQAPGRITHEKGVPFDDPSGERLRAWLGVEREQFYDDALFAIVPMGFCFPGTGKSGDLAPRKECAIQWREKILQQLSAIELTLVIGKFAIDWHLTQTKGKNLTETVRNWREHLQQSNVLPLPHPSPRNNLWLKKNPWFEEECLPELQKRIALMAR